MRVTLIAIAFLSVAFHPVFSRPLDYRFKKLSCAVVHIETPSGLGTGFFVNGSGRLLTAAHVTLDRAYAVSSGKPELITNAHLPIRFHFSDGHIETLNTLPLSATDLENAALDVSVVETGLKTPCFIPIGNSTSSHVGDRVIAIGFPGSSTSPVLYEGRELALFHIR